MIEHHTWLRGRNRGPCLFSMFQNKHCVLKPYSQRSYKILTWSRNRTCHIWVTCLLYPQMMRSSLRGLSHSWTLLVCQSHLQVRGKNSLIYFDQLTETHSIICVTHISVSPASIFVGYQGLNKQVVFSRSNDISEITEWTRQLHLSSKKKNNKLKIGAMCEL